MMLRKIAPRSETKAGAGSLGRAVLPRRRNRKRRSLREMGAVAWDATKVTVARMLPATLATLALVVLGMGLFAGYHFLRTSPRFAIAGVEVLGATHMSREEVIAVAGVAVGSNIFALDTDQVEKRLEQLPWVKQVEVHRQLPRTLEIKITERVAVAAVNTDGLYLMDAAGTLFKRADTRRDELVGLLIVSGIERDAFRENASAASALVKHAYELAMQWNQLASDDSMVGEVRIEHDDSLTFYTGETGMALHVGALTAAQVPVLHAMFEASHNSIAQDERTLVRAIYLDNQSRRNYVTIAFAK